MGEKITKDAVKKMLSSNMALAAAAAYTAMLLCAVMGNVEEGGGFLWSVCIEAFPILLCVGLWLLYSGAKNSDQINTVGFTLIKADVIFELVMAIIAGALLLMGGIVCTIVGFLVDGAGIDMSAIEKNVEQALSSNNIAAKYYSQYRIAELNGDVLIDIIGVAGILILFFGIIFLTVVVIYNVFVIKAVNSIRCVAETGIPKSGFPMFVIVMLYIKIVFIGIGALGSIIYLISGNIWKFLYVIANLVFNILVIVCINKYKEVMKKTEERVAVFNNDDAA